MRLIQKLHERTTASACSRLFLSEKWCGSGYQALLLNEVRDFGEGSGMRCCMRVHTLHHVVRAPAS